MKGYEEVKKFVFSKLKESTQPDINKEIDNIKKVVLSTNMHLEIFGIEKIDLSERDWLEMRNELETKFNVKHDIGVLIKGEEEQERYQTWWTGKTKQEKELYYWQRYKTYLQDSVPPQVIQTIDVDTDVVMNNIENPLIERFDRRGMVVGHVQSGKTGNYSGLICKAADAGYKFIIVIAGGMNNLRNQTQERINKSFVGRNRGQQVGVGVGNSQDNKLPISLTTQEKDFNTQDANRNSQSTNFDTNITPIILVIKKNTHSLKNVIDWLNNQYPNIIEEHAMLMIDDESDYASIDTTKPENEPTAINRGIRKILAKFNKSIYVAYTATPYANIFIDHQAEHTQYEDDLFPRDFIYALNAPDNYFGARTIFLDDERKYLVSIDDYQDVIPVRHKKDFDLQSIPKSLFEAIRVFLINIAIRSLRGQGKHNSMLIHATRFTLMHQNIAFFVTNYLEEIKRDVSVYGKFKNADFQSEIIKTLKETFDKYYQHLDFGWPQVLVNLCSVVSNTIIREVHQQTKIPLEYRDDVITNAIVVGGTSLSRGYTLEGLSVSYFLRNTVFYDTLMQMGRWFGYREGYQDLCKIYMPETIIDNFAHIIEATEDLFTNLKKMSSENMTPKDFGLAVRQHPDSILQVTARNKQRATQDIYFDMKLDGSIKEAVYLHKDKDKQIKNINAVKQITQCLGDNFKIKNKKHLWIDIDKTIVKVFLDQFRVVTLDPFGLKTRMPIDFIKKYVNEQNTLWDVALYSGDGKEYEITKSVKINKVVRSKIQDKGQYYELANRKLSSENPDSIVLTEEQFNEIKKNIKDLNAQKLTKIKQSELGVGKAIRESMTKPLLMLYILESNLEEDLNLAAFGISFPGGIKSTGRTVKLKINSVYIQDILQNEEFDD